MFTIHVQEKWFVMLMDSDTEVARRVWSEIDCKSSWQALTDFVQSIIAAHVLQNLQVESDCVERWMRLTMLDRLVDEPIFEIVIVIVIELAFGASQLLLLRLLLSVALVRNNHFVATATHESLGLCLGLDTDHAGKAEDAFAREEGDHTSLVEALVTLPTRRQVIWSIHHVTQQLYCTQGSKV
jgi:hypothetical protein